MRAIVLTSIYLGFFSLLFAQSSTIQLKVDKSFFDQTKGLIHASSETGATLSYMVMPYDYNQALMGMKGDSNEEIKVISQGYLDGSRTKIYHKKGKIETGNGYVIIEIYAIKYSDAQTIMLTGNYKEEHHHTVGNKIELTARSVNDI